MPDPALEESLEKQLAQRAGRMIFDDAVVLDNHLHESGNVSN